MIRRNVRRICRAYITLGAVLLAVIPLPVIAADQDSKFVLDMDCGTLENAFGPYDYTNLEHVKQHLPIVERFHFSSDVENLRRGQSSELPGGDLDYVLRAFPNHHRALYAMTRYHLRYSKMRVPPDANFSAECYLQRAVRFKPDDSNVFVVYGLYLEKLDRTEEALERYRIATELNPQNAEAHYDLGLLYVKLNRLEDAMQHARIAYDLGYPLMGLKKKLQSKRAWSEPSDN